MTHLLSEDNENLVTDISNHHLFFTNEEKYKVGDRIIIQNDESESECSVIKVEGEIPALRKGYYIFILTPKEI